MAARRLDLLADELFICRLPAGTSPPAFGSGVWSVTVTDDEVSVISTKGAIPGGRDVSGPWRALKARGPSEHDLVGILRSIADPLADAGVPIFAMSTFDTDYVLVPVEQLDDALSALTQAGHVVES